jgi:branched-chain amino acid transport system substrate-binding protein
MKSTLLGMATALALLSAPAMAQNAVKIGFVTTLTGPNAAIGQDMKDAVELAVDHLGKKMGKLDVQILYEDDEQKPDVGKQKGEKLIGSDKVNFVAGVIWSNVMLAMVKPIFDSETFMISGNAGPSPLAGEQCSDYFFSASWNNDQTPMAMGEVLNRKGVKKVYLMTGNYAAGRDMAAGVKLSFKGEIIGEDLTRWPDQLDFSAEMAKIRNAKPDAVWIFYPGAHGVQFLTQYKQAGLLGTIPLYNSFSVDAITLPLQKDLAMGILGTQEYVVDLPNDANRKFVADFRKKYNKYPSYYAAQSYDAINLIDSAVKATDGNLRNKDALRAALRKANFKSVRGDFKFGNNHFPIQNFYLQETTKDAEGNYTLKTLETVYTAHQDPHAKKCDMKW